MAAEHEALQFDPETHTYTVGGAQVPSVTQILSLLTDAIYARVPDRTLEGARLRGTNVHGWTELVDLGEADVAPDAITALDGTTLTPEHAEWPYVQAWLRFRQESGFVPEIVEQRLYHPRHHYAGTVDRIGSTNGRRGLIEIKTSSSVQPTASLQTAAYLEAFNHGLPRGKRALSRSTVQLRNDGTYRIQQHLGSTDLAVFLAAKMLFDWGDFKSRLI